MTLKEVENGGKEEKKRRGKGKKHGRSQVALLARNNRRANWSSRVSWEKGGGVRV